MQKDSLGARPKNFSPENQAVLYSRAGRVMHSADMGSPRLRLIRSPQSETSAGDTSRAIKSGGRKQVAAVCYRIGRSGIEFLLVRTRKGRWTFPKGGIKRGWTQPQSAALEAFEEAGVHGRIEEVSFTRYSLHKDSETTSASSAQMEIRAYLCEVSSLEPPQEANRHPTWFSPQSAKIQLRKDRRPESGAELARVIDRALGRIQRLTGRSRSAPDSLHKAPFELLDTPLARKMQHVVARFIRAHQATPNGTALQVDSTRRNRILRLVSGPPPKS